MAHCLVEDEPQWHIIIQQNSVILCVFMLFKNSLEGEKRVKKNNQGEFKPLAKAWMHKVL